MTAKEMIGCICFALAIASFVLMYLMPIIRRKKTTSRSRHYGLGTYQQEKSLARTVELTGLMISLQLAIIGTVLIT